jgi:hypothetical protein
MGVTSWIGAWRVHQRFIRFHSTPLSDPHLDAKPARMLRISETGIRGRYANPMDFPFDSNTP